MKLEYFPPLRSIFNEITGTIAKAKQLADSVHKHIRKYYMILYTVCPHFRELGFLVDQRENVERLDGNHIERRLIVDEDNALPVDALQCVLVLNNRSLPYRL